MKEKSIFITVLSWILIVITGFTLFISIIQNIAMYTMVNEGMFNNVEPSTGSVFTDFLFRNFKTIVILFGLITLLAFISAFGLLKRKEWARKTYVALFSIGILYMLILIVVQYFFNKDFNNDFLRNDHDFNRTILIMQNLTTAFEIGMGVLFGWLLSKIVSKNIKNEFNKTQANTLQ